MEGYIFPETLQRSCIYHCQHNSNNLNMNITCIGFFFIKNWLLRLSARTQIIVLSS
jgi:hypothetical protein